MATWKIDPAHTSLSFAAKYMMVTTVRGTFTTVDGELELDENNPTATRGEIRVDASSLTTGVAQRDHHLRSADFLSVDAHPVIIGRVRGVKPAGDRYEVAVDLTIRGVTRPLVLSAEHLGVFQGLQGGRRAAFHLSGTLDRNDWRLNWNMALEAGGWLVSSQINLDIEVAVDEVAVEQAA